VSHRDKAGQRFCCTPPQPVRPNGQRFCTSPDLLLIVLTRHSMRLRSQDSWTEEPASNTSRPILLRCSRREPPVKDEQVSLGDGWLGRWARAFCGTVPMSDGRTLQALMIPSR
jgi:hypothetical protein